MSVKEYNVKILIFRYLWREKTWPNLKTLLIFGHPSTACIFALHYLSAVLLQTLFWATFSLALEKNAENGIDLNIKVFKNNFWQNLHYVITQTL
jgi:hypothetical protein